MNLINWNIRGLGQPAKRFLVKGFLHLHFADVCCLQETKLEEITSVTWKEVGGSYLDQFVFLPANRSAGGIIVGV